MSSRSLFLAAATVAVFMLPSAASSAACSVDNFKITARKNVGCQLAKTVTVAKVSDKALPKGWHCTSGPSIIPKGKCTKGAKSFRYAYAA